jgi:hypothetical protein
MLFKVVECDNGDKFEVEENVDGAVLKYFVLDNESKKHHLDISMNFNNASDAIKAIDGFDDIKDML